MARLDEKWLLEQSRGWAITPGDIKGNKKKNKGTLEARVDRMLYKARKRGLGQEAGGEAW